MRRFKRVGAYITLLYFQLSSNSKHYLEKGLEKTKFPCIKNLTKCRVWYVEGAVQVIYLFEGAFIEKKS